MEQNDKRGLYNGFGDGLAQAFEFAVTPAIFGAIGYFIDRAVGTLPLFTILLSLFCLVGIFVKTWYVYDAEMRAHEERSPWARREQSSALPERRP